MRGENMPRVICEDVSLITNEEWLKFRKKGIGGSDVGTLLGVNKYQTVFDLYYNKIGAVIDKTFSQSSRRAMEIGHLLEGYIATLFAEEYPSIEVIEDNRMYQHDEYDFMLANVDRVLILPDGRRAILECKTLSDASEWSRTNVCANIQGYCPLSYEWQTRQYMAVYNVDMAFVAGLDLKTKELYIVIVYRNMQLEKRMIEAESLFWQSVQKRIAPHTSEIGRVISSLRKETFLRFYAAKNGESYVVNKPEHIDTFAAISEQMDRQTYYSKQVDKAKEMKTVLAMQIFIDAEHELGFKPNVIALDMVKDGRTIKQDITLDSKSSVEFDAIAFVEDYNAIFPNKINEFSDQNTLMLLLSENMPQSMGKYITLTEKKAIMRFGKRKIREK